MQKFSLIFLFVTMTFVSFQSNAENLKNPWSILAQNDIESIYNQLRENHPGSVDVQNPSFQKWLNEGKESAIANLKNVNSFDGATYLIRKYINGFNDGHLNVRFEVGHDNLNWTGIIISRRTGKYLVNYVKEVNVSMPSIGSELLSCDGLSPDQVLDKNIFPYSGNSQLESQRVAYAPWLLVDGGNPFINRLKNCVFLVDNQKKEFKLIWEGANKTTIRTLAQDASFKNTFKIESHKFGKNGMWFSLPTFNLDESNIKKINAISKIAKRARKSKFVVFDVRGNTGGSSEFGVQILKSLYGEKFVSEIEKKASSGPVDWRVSKENVAHIEKLMPMLEKQMGSESPRMKWFNKLLSGYKLALKNGENFYREPEFESLHSIKNGKENQNNPSFTGKVYFLTDGACFSACLDFADVVMRLPNVMQVGAPTWADTRYMEVRNIELPSGIVRISFPIKVYRDRKRGDNEPYAPKKHFYGDISDTLKVEKWLLSFI